MGGGGAGDAGCGAEDPGRRELAQAAVAAVCGPISVTSLPILAPGVCHYFPPGATALHALTSTLQVEAAFRRMKDPHFVSWEPMFHWTDQKIRVHAFYCVLALTLASLLQREVARQGMNLSADRLLQKLNDIQEVAAIYPESAKRKDAIVLSQRDREQRQLFDLLGLDRYTIATR